MNRLIVMIAGIELILVAAAAAEDSVYSCPHRPTAVCAVVTDQYQPLGRATGAREMTPAAFDEDLLSPFLADEPWPADCWPCPRTWEPRVTVRSRCCRNWT